ncbi:MAG TPA: Gfo/Idh/MocA family oxidoreductase [Armatimonadota bacterium]|mgnify:CR=1 FL=1|nr:Gfo/Idh/MocA family oxidoreductase [Armatimonadota bacterium]HOJ20457.1 Gfo/Idh/MocA family oxidoreductase [Armatimonadota bacterium]HOM81906.1 Gfo/Idh/MocA family oxidoreductase [Armatimonadota bacterium]HPO71884.1 Gfo/Idh/MocA family oxidoreductase [Armatimonadota bacterium]
MTYRCAFLGCGPRARSHALAYQQITRGEIVALCDLNESRLNDFGDTFSVAARYTDLDEMLRKEKPDVVHLVTPPTLRVGLMTRLAEAGVPGVIVEKPICIGADDYKALRELEARSETRFVVNHQLRHHPRILEFLGEVSAGKIGQVRFLDATARLPMAGQGVHVLDLMFAFNGYAKPTSVFGASSGYDDINGTHPTAKSAEYLITFENGARGVLMAGVGAPTFTEGPTYMHKRIAVYGTHGFRHWRMDAWERSLPDGTVESQTHVYREEDIIGQAGLTNALFDWLDDPARVHPNNLATSLDEWLVILAGYASTVEARAIELPFDPPADLLDQFKRFVGAA